MLVSKALECRGSVLEEQLVEGVPLVVAVLVEEVVLAGGQLVVDVGLVHDEEPCDEKFRVVEKQFFGKIRVGKF